MNSINFPKMFTSSSTRISSDLSATKQNCRLLLKSEKGEFVSDPYFGIRIKKYIFDQNSYVLRDILVDEIYTQLAQFMPQLLVNRKDIQIVQQGSKVYAKFKAQNRIDFVTNMYEIVLVNPEEK